MSEDKKDTKIEQEAEFSLDLIKLIKKLPDDLFVVMVILITTFFQMKKVENLQRQLQQEYYIYVDNTTQINDLRNQITRLNNILYQKDTDVVQMDRYIRQLQNRVRQLESKTKQ